jgi:nucleotide-binding universal stress UspA family protein
MNKFNHIVYVLDNDTSESSPSFHRAINLAKTNQSDLTLLKILPDMPSSLSSTLNYTDEKELHNKVLAQETAKLQTLISSIDADLNANIELRVGKKYIETIRAVQANNYDLVIKEVDTVDWLERLFGSEDMHLLRKRPCPVWLMKKDEKPEYKNIMVAIDFDDELEVDKNTDNAALNKVLLELSLSLSLSNFTTLHVVNAYDVPQAGFVSLWVDQPEAVEKELFQAEYRKRQHKMNTLMEELKHAIGDESFEYLSPRTHLVQGPPSRELPKLADRIEADLVVMGTVARTGIAGVLIGNTAENVLSQLHCSVLTIKPKDFVSPVS